MSFKPYYIILTLLPAPVLASDFLQIWFLIYLMASIFILSFFIIPKYFIVLNLIPLSIHILNFDLGLSPELTVPILANTIISFLISARFERNISTYPFFLWIGTFALFNSSLYYLLYILLSSIFIFNYLTDLSSVSIKQIFINIYTHKKQLFYTFIATALIFFLFPRFHGFLPTIGPNQKGKIGYSKEISNSNTSNLNLSNQVAFFAELDKKLALNQLYWRGRVHTFTDGYNWKSKKIRSIKSKYKYKYKTNQKNLIFQKIKFEQDFDGDIILLDRAIKVNSTNLNVYRIGQTSEFKTTFHKKKSFIQATSSLSPSKISLTQKEKIDFLQLPNFVSRSLQKFSNSITAIGAKAIISQFKYHIIKDKFSYSLSPGKLKTMDEFIANKVGYCTHYASLLGLILRIKGVPSRLVSGFQGGRYNEVSSHYVISSNDAHAWVEYYDNNTWNRVDPTSFISPDRINLGGEAFLNPGVLDARTNNPINKAFYNTYQVFQALNHKFSVFIDNYDKNFQTQISKYFKLSLKNFFFFGLLFIVLLLILYYLSPRFIKIFKRKKIHPADKLLKSFLAELKLISNKDITLLAPIRKKILGTSYEKEAQDFIDLYEKIRFGNQANIKDLKLLFGLFISRKKKSR